MSGAEKLKEKIIADATGEAEALLANARAKEAEILAQAEEEAAAKTAKIKATVEKQINELRSRYQTIAELDARKAILAAKEELIEDTFKQALARLQSMETKAYQELMSTMLLAAAQTGTEEIIVSATDKERFSAELLSAVNAELARQGKQGKLTLAAETRETQGGFILRAENIEINCSFAALLRMQREELEPEVAAILFS
ncbi:MAG: V-type ATP synthase subunit E [Firmicutes bacterium]|nr:V-type ATP synthase subunit E [Bacillota bacterium]